MTSEEFDKYLQYALDHSASLLGRAVISKLRDHSYLVFQDGTNKVQAVSRVNGDYVYSRSFGYGARHLRTGVRPEALRSLIQVFEVHKLPSTSAIGEATFLPFPDKTLAPASAP